MVLCLVHHYLIMVLCSEGQPIDCGFVFWVTLFWSWSCILKSIPLIMIVGTEFNSFGYVPRFWRQHKEDSSFSTFSDHLKMYQRWYACSDKTEMIYKLYKWFGITTNFLVWADHKIWSKWYLLAVFNLTKTELDDRVVIMWLLSNAPPQVHHLKSHTHTHVTLRAAQTNRQLIQSKLNLLL